MYTKNKIKIAFLASADSIHSAKWINFFAAQGHQILWVSIAKKSQYVHPSIEFVDLSKISLLSQILKTRALLMAWNPAVVHVHSVGLLGLLALLSVGAKMRLVATPWGSDVLFGKKNPFKRFFISRILVRANLVTTDAEYMIKEVESLGGVSEKCRIINFGIDTSKFRKYPTNTSLLKKLNLLEQKQRGPLVVSTRNFEPVYDIETFLRAVPIVLKEVPNAFFPIVGKGTDRSKLEELVGQLGIEHCTKFMGYVENTELPEFLSNMDAYVSTSLSDAGLAASTSEAMACEVPCIISDAAENGAWIKHGVSGYLFPKKDYGTLAKYVVETLKNKALATDFGRHGRQAIVDRNDYVGEMMKMEKIYQLVSDSFEVHAQP